MLGKATGRRIDEQIPSAGRKADEKICERKGGSDTRVARVDSFKFSAASIRSMAAVSYRCLLFV